MSFAPLGLNAPICQAVAAAGYTAPTPVQLRVIPEALTGRDLMVSSQTGSGKTAAFMLPALQLLSIPHARPGRGPRVLVLVPTRELSQQVTKAAETYGRGAGRVRVVSIVGGMPYPVQNKLLAAGVDVLVATPGRLLDQMQSGRVDLEAIVAKMPEERQTLLFSATLESNIANLARAIMRDPARIAIDAAQARHESIEQRLHLADDMGHKNRLLDHLLRDTAMNQAIVFTATKRAADELAQDLQAKGFAVAALHGDMNQGARNRTIQAMHRGRVRVLVATDVAARGIDVQGISHVINYDLPRQAEDYVHRIGRTGRAGRTGTAISLVNAADRAQVRSIERYTAQRIPVEQIAGLEPTLRMHTGNSSGPGGRPSGKRPGGNSAGRRFNNGPSRGGRR